MSGPLEREFAQVRSKLWTASAWTTREEVREEDRDAALAALSSIERHVQDMESLIEMASDPYRWDEFLAALPASNGAPRVGSFHPSASPSDGEPGWFLYHVPSNNVVGEAPTLKEAQAMHAEWVKADERNATEIEVLAFEPDGGGA